MPAVSVQTNGVQVLTLKNAVNSVVPRPKHHCIGAAATSGNGVVSFLPMFTFGKRLKTVFNQALLDPFMLTGYHANKKSSPTV
jgi:hypothetical protein